VGRGHLTMISRQIEKLSGIKLKDIVDPYMYTNPHMNSLQFYLTLIRAVPGNTKRTGNCRLRMSTC